jgi:hypothetical protein
MVSNPGFDPARIGTIVVHIPMGDDSNRTLSASRDLPQPVYDAGTGWSATASHGDVTLTPPQGKVAGAFDFTLPRIAVNTKEGVVRVSVKEGSGPAVAACALVKHRADFVVTSFTATPAVLYDVDQRVTLKWAVTTAGKDLVFSVHSDSWEPRDCIDGGPCYSAKDGQDGVPTDPLDDSTTFALDVIATDSGGHRSIVGTVETHVRVQLPKISSSTPHQYSRAGRLVSLHWLAWNAGGCTVNVDGTETPAPLDTYLHGWYTLLTGNPATRQLGVTATATSGTADEYRAFPPVNATDVVTVGLPGNFTGVATAVAAAKGGALGLVATNGALFELDVLAGTLKPLAGFQAYVEDVAIVPDGSLAVAVGPAVWIVQLGTGHVDTLPGVNGSRVVVSPDGRIAFVVSSPNGNQARSVQPIDIGARKPTGAPIALGGVSAPFGPRAAVSRDGATAFVTNNDQTVTAIDVKSLSGTTLPAALSGQPTAIAVGPDGAPAIAVWRPDHTPAIQWIDKATGHVTATIAVESVDGPVLGMQLTPDGRVLLGCAVDGIVGFDSGARVQLPGSVDLSEDAFGLAVAPDVPVAIAIASKAVMIL